MDGTAPIILGADNGRIYCGSVTLTVTDEYLDTVTLNGNSVQLTDGKLILNPKNGEQTVTATDKAGNTASLTVKINDGHAYGQWISNGNGTHTRICRFNTQHTETENCFGGKATCTDRAKCEVCGAEYGELDANNHTNLVYVPAKAASEYSEGNIEYRYCTGCGKYYRNASATEEIDKADTVINKLPHTQKPTQTGDTNSLVLWLALLFISGSTAVGTTVIIKRKKRCI